MKPEIVYAFYLLLGIGYFYGTFLVWKAVL